MSILIRLAILAAAGAAGLAMARRKGKTAPTPDNPQVVYLSDEDAVIDAPRAAQEPRSAAAEVLRCVRRMDPITLTGGSEATFLLADGTEVRLHISGEGGLHLKEGDVGQLTWQEQLLISFEKDNGEVIGGMYYVPAGAEDETDA